MTEPFAQRTLVKSPPELWAEISDVESLARHLGAFGEIRITRTEPETKVAWEGETARGTVELKASGWGTKVTLTAAATAARADGAEDQRPSVVADTEDQRPSVVADTEDQPASVVAGAAGGASLESQWASSAEQKVRDRYMCAAPTGPARNAPRSGAVRAPEGALPVAESQQPTGEVDALTQAAARDGAADREAEADGGRPQGFLSRLFGRFGRRDAHRAAQPEAGPPETAPEFPQPAADAAGSVVTPPEVARAAPEPAPVTAEPVAEAEVAPDAAPVSSEPSVAAPEPAPISRVPLPSPDSGAPGSSDTLDENAIISVLTGVLDELGAAHHRPFSRG